MPLPSQNQGYGQNPQAPSSPFFDATGFNSSGLSKDDPVNAQNYFYDPMSTAQASRAYYIPGYSGYQQQIGQQGQYWQNQGQNQGQQLWNQTGQNNQGLISALQAQAAGNGPSLAESQYQKNSQENLASLIAQSQSGAYGNSPALAQRQLMQQQGQLGQQSAMGAAQLKAQEQLAAQGQLQQAIGMQQQQAALQNNQFDKMTQYYMSRGLDLAQAQQQARAGLQNLQLGYYKSNQQAQSDAQKNAIAQQAADQSLIDSIFSDVNLKTNIKPVGDSSGSPEEPKIVGGNSDNSQGFENLIKIIKANSDSNKPVRNMLQSGLQFGANQGLNKLGEMANQSGYDNLGSVLSKAGQFAGDPKGTMFQGAQDVGSKLMNSIPSSVSTPMASSLGSDITPSLGYGANAASQLGSGAFDIGSLSSPMASTAASSADTLGSGLTSSLGSGLSSGLGGSLSGAGLGAMHVLGGVQSGLHPLGGSDPVSTQLMTAAEPFAEGFAPGFAPPDAALTGSGIAGLTGALSHVGEGGGAEAKGAAQGVISEALPQMAGQAASSTGLLGGAVPEIASSAPGIGEVAGTGVSGVSSALSAVLPALGLFLSDENQKGNKSKDTTDMERFLDVLKAYKYNYKNPQVDGYGPHYGVMAQDLEKSPVGQTMVKNTPRGKMIDPSKAISVMLASQADINKRLTTLEGGRK